MTTCMLLHESLDQVLDGLTPFESWNGRKPNLKNFRVFGCLAWAKIPPQKHKALEPQRKPCIFVGYANSNKAYKLMDP